MKWLIKSQKQNCERCKALYMSQYEITCRLGIHIDYQTTKPTEPCFKPLTYSEFLEARRLMSQMVKP